MPDAKEKLRRRSQNRQAFTASALVFEPKSETLLRARTADLGPDGCFIDTLNPFAPGTMVKARIEKGGASFEASAKVVYSLTAMGMGLAFQAVAPEQLWVIHEWLGSGSSPEISVAVEAEEFPREAFLITDRKRDVHCEALCRLIVELMDRGLLSDEKGNAILETLTRCPEK
jgi:PilZ domain